MATVTEFEAWLRERGLPPMIGQQRRVAAVLLAEMEFAGMTGRGAGKTWLLRRLDEFLSS